MGMDGRGSELVDGGRMALDNKTSLLNTPLLSSSPRGARDHFSDSPFKHSRKDTSLDDSAHLTDGKRTFLWQEIACGATPAISERLCPAASQQTAAWTSRSSWPSSSKSCPITTSALRKGRRRCGSCWSWSARTHYRCGMNTSRPSCCCCWRRWVTERYAGSLHAEESQLFSSDLKSLSLF